VDRFLQLLHNEPLDTTTFPFSQWLEVVDLCDLYRSDIAKDRLAHRICQATIRRATTVDYYIVAARLRDAQLARLVVERVPVADLVNLFKDHGKLALVPTAYVYPIVAAYEYKGGEGKVDWEAWRTRVLDKLQSV
jgi:hypothetical protein